MIILRTKHFGFYDQSGKLLGIYTRGNGLKRFQNWKEGILRQYKTKLKESGLSTDLSEKEIEKILREQSRSRDAAVNEWAKERRNLTSQIDKNTKRLNATAKKLTELEKAGKISHVEAEASKDFYGNELGGAISILENNRKNIGLGQLGLKREPKGRFAKYSKPGAHEAYDESKINDFLSERQQAAAAQKKQQQATVDAQNANQNLQEKLNNANKQISDLTAQNQLLQQHQGIHAKNYNNVVNQNKDLTNKNKDLNSRYNESVEEIKRLHEKYNKDVEDLINSHKNSMSVVEQQRREIEDSRDRWKKGAITAGSLGVAAGGLGIAGIYSARRNGNKDKE